MVNYPAQIDNILSLPPAADGATSVSASVVNRLREAIIATQTELGVKPSSTYTTVRNRLDYLEEQIIFLEGDLGGTKVSPLVIGIQGNPVSSADPTLNQVLSWTGSEWVPTNVSTVTGALGIPGGNDTYVQFNEDGYLGGDTGFTYNKTTNVLSLSDAISIGALPATSGAIRLGNNIAITARDSLNSVDVSMMSLSAGDERVYGAATTWTNLMGAGVDIYGTSLRFLETNRSAYALELAAADTDHIDFGIIPATTGNIRLKQDFAIVARNEDDDGNLGVLTTYNGGDGYQELSLGTFDDGASNHSYDRVSLCANNLLYVWMDNSVSPFQVGKTTDGYYATFITSASNFAIAGATTSITQAASFGSGQGVMYWGYSNIIPTTNPNSGIVAYVDSGDGYLKYRKSDGNIISLTGGGGGGGTPGGLNTQVQYNNSGTFGGISGATTDGTTISLVSPNILTDMSLGPIPATFGEIRLSNDYFIWARDSGNGSNVPILGLSSSDVVQFGVSGGFPIEISAGNSDPITYRAIEHYFLGTFQFGGLAGGTLDVGGGIGVIGLDNASSAPSGSPTNGVIIYAQDGYLKYKQPTGVIVAIAPGGIDTQIQFNDNGSFGGDAGLTYNQTTNVLSLSDTIEIGTTPAAAGNVRISNVSTARVRNAADSNDLYLWETTSGDDLIVGSNMSTTTANQFAHVYMYSKAIGSVELGVGTAALITADVNKIAITRPISQTRSTNASTGTLNDVDIGTNLHIHFTNGTGPTVNGFTGGLAGRMLFVTFTAAGTIANQAAGSTSTNRIAVGSGSDISISAGETVMFIYDAANGRWLPVGSEV